MKRLSFLLLAIFFFVSCSGPIDVAGTYLCNRVEASASLRSTAQEVFLGHTLRVYTIHESDGILVMLDSESEAIEFSRVAPNQYSAIDYTGRGNEVSHMIIFSASAMYYRLENITNGRSMTTEVYATKQEQLP